MGKVAISEEVSGLLSRADYLRENAKKTLKTQRIIRTEIIQRSKLGLPYNYLAEKALSLAENVQEYEQMAGALEKRAYTKLTNKN